MARKLTLPEKQWAFSVCISELILWASYVKGWGIAMGEVERPQLLQEIYLKEKKTKTLKSRHGVRCAADLHLWIDGKHVNDPDRYRELGEKWEELGKKKDLSLRWGGRFGDDPKTVKIEGWDSVHFEIA